MSGLGQQEPESKLGLFERTFWKDSATGKYMMGGLLWNRQPKMFKQVTFRFTLVDEAQSVLHREDVSMTGFDNLSLAHQGPLMPYARTNFSHPLSVSESVAGLTSGYWIEIVGTREDTDPPSMSRPDTIFGYFLAKSSEESQQLLKANPEFAKAKERATGASAVHFAAARNDVALLELVKQSGAPLDAKGFKGMLPVHVAAATNQRQSLEWLHKLGQSLDLRTIDGDQPIHFAALYNSDTTLGYLIESKVDVNAARPDGNTALHLSSRKGYGRLVVQLLDSKANVEAPTKEGLRPLHMAVGGNFTKVASLLIERGADVNGTESRTPWMPLHTAAKVGAIDCIELLLSKGANPSIKTEKGNTPAMLARKYGHRKSAEVLEQAEKALLKG